MIEQIVRRLALSLPLAMAFGVLLSLALGLLVFAAYWRLSLVWSSDVAAAVVGLAILIVLGIAGYLMLREPRPLIGANKPDAPRSPQPSLEAALRLVQDNPVAATVAAMTAGMLFGSSAGSREAFGAALEAACREFGSKSE